MYIDRVASIFPGQEFTPDFTSYLDRVAGIVPDYKFRTFFQTLDRSKQRHFDRLDKAGKIAAFLVGQFNQGSADHLFIGSARGASGSLERDISDHQAGKVLTPVASPLTTAGCIASEAARINLMQTNSLSVSMTCSSALHAIILAAEKITLGKSTYAIAGGVEAPVTPYISAQFEALRLLSDRDSALPCRPLEVTPGNSVVLSEGGALFGLTAGWGKYKLTGWGEAAQLTENPVSYADQALEKAMRLALEASGRQAVDLVLPHAPGTRVGDPIEMGIIQRVMGKNTSVMPMKWLTGHTLGASGAISLALAARLLDGAKIDVPYDTVGTSNIVTTPKSIMVNATGFGGNAACLIIERSGD